MQGNMFQVFSHSDSRSIWFIFEHKKNHCFKNNPDIIRARSRDPSGLKIVVWIIIVVKCQFYVFLRFVLESLYKTTQYISIIISKVPCITTLHPPINLNILFWRQIGAAATMRSSKETTKQSMQPILFQCVECSGVINILFIIEL